MTVLNLKSHDQEVLHFSKIPAAKVVRRERYWGHQYRCFSLPQEINDQAAHAHYENGVLMLSLPKKTGGVSKTLAIK